MIDNVGSEAQQSFRRNADKCVVENAIDARDVALNEDLVQTLVISYNFPPYNDASAVTVAKRLRYFAEPVHVVSQDMSRIRKTDSQLSRIVLPYVTKQYSIGGAPTFSAWKGIETFVAESMQLIKTQLDSNKYRRIYSRSMFPASHFLAAHIKSLYPEIHWIAEFSDPLRHTVEGADRPGGSFKVDAWAKALAMNVSSGIREDLLAQPDVFRWCESLTFEMADDLWFTNAYQMDVMFGDAKDINHRGRLAKKSSIHSHPTLPDSFYSLGRSPLTRIPGKLYVGYFGEFYSNRGLGDLFKSLLMMPTDELQDIEVHVFTSNVQICIDAVNAAGLTGIVNTHQSLEFLDFCTTAKSMDLLVVCDVVPGVSYSSNPYLPSKVSDYLGTDSDILAYVWPGSPLSSIDNVDKVSIGDTFGGAKYLSRSLSKVRGKNV